MSRSMLLVLMMMILVIMSHYEWRQLLVTDVDVIGESQKHQETLKSEEVIKEKIILTQEKNIHRLNELVKTLREQLNQCQCNNGTVNGTLSSVPENVPMVEDVPEVELEETPEPEPEPEPED